MIKYLIIVLFILPFSVIGQTKIDTTKIKLKYNFTTQPSYFLDSIYVDISKTYIDLENIKSIKVNKDTFSYLGVLKFGKVFITSKNKNHTWATLADFKTQKTIADTVQPKIYIIDGNLISDTTNVRIEVTSIKSIDILNMAEESKQMYSGRTPNTVFLIMTKQKHKKKGKRQSLKHSVSYKCSGQHNNERQTKWNI